MKKITIMATAILLLAACQKESTLENTNQSDALSAQNSTKQKAKVTRPISNNLQSDPNPNTTSPYGGVLAYGTSTHLGNVTAVTFNTSFTPISPGVFSITSEDTTYAANGDELWGRGSIVVHFPTDGSTTATITGGSIFVGGTGRFVGATGYVIYENMVYNTATGHESHTSHGEITY
jgi:hypothetical protein